MTASTDLGEKRSYRSKHILEQFYESLDNEEANFVILICVTSWQFYCDQFHRRDEFDGLDNVIKWTLVGGWHKGMMGMAS